MNFRNEDNRKHHEINPNPGNSAQGKISQTFQKTMQSFKNIFENLSANTEPSCAADVFETREQSQLLHNYDDTDAGVRGTNSQMYRQTNLHTDGLLSDYSSSDNLLTRTISLEHLYVSDDFL